ncbi:MAG: class D beta-lactamase [Pseudomonadota bacterium]
MKFHRLLIVSAIVATPAAHARDVCTAVADAKTGKVLVQQGDCAGRVTPASTFKIAISLMGYDAGVLKDEHTPKLPFVKGYVDWRDNWREDTDPTKWMKDSVVWYSQQLTRSLGMGRFAAYTRQFQFGNADVTGDAGHDGLTQSWLDSSLKVSPLEQLAFLGKLVNHQLGVSEHAYAMTAALTQAGQVPGGWTIHGKTGAASGYGWYVGWASKGAQTTTFARLIVKDESQPQDVPAGYLARDALLKDLPALLTR